MFSIETIEVHLQSFPDMGTMNLKSRTVGYRRLGLVVVDTEVYWLKLGHGS